MTMKRQIFYIIIFFQLKFNSVMPTNQTISNQSEINFIKLTESIVDPVNFVIYTFPILIIVGTICNILTFLVMRRKKLRNQSTGFYMAVLAIADQLALLVGCLSHWLYSYKNISILHISTFSCKIFSVVLYTTMDFSVWMVVIMTIERFIAVTFPLRSMYFCTVKKAKVATLILTCILFSMNSHFLFSHSYVTRRNNESGCQSKSEAYDYFIQNLWPWIDASKYSFIPLLTIIFFNVLIIYNLIKASTIIKNMSSNHKLQTNKQNSTPSGHNTQSNSSSNNRRLTIMLLVVSMTFCILSTPLVLLQILEKANIGSRYVAFYSICLLLQYFNHSINFFLYVISGKLFRREFIALLCDSIFCFKRKIISQNEKSTFSESLHNSRPKNGGYIIGNTNSKQKLSFDLNKVRNPLFVELEKEAMLLDKEKSLNNAPLLSVSSVSGNHEYDYNSTGISKNMEKCFKN
jgi:hypothetical protein